MITKTEEIAVDELLAMIADREYKRGLDHGLGVAKTGAAWLRMETINTRTGKPARRQQYTKAQIADMIDARIVEAQASR